MDKSIEILVKAEGEKTLLYIKKSNGLDRKTALELHEKLFAEKTQNDIKTVLNTLPNK